MSRRHEDVTAAPPQCAFLPHLHTTLFYHTATARFLNLPPQHNFLSLCPSARSWDIATVRIATTLLVLNTPPQWTSYRFLTTQAQQDFSPHCYSELFCSSHHHRMPFYSIATVHFLVTPPQRAFSSLFPSRYISTVSPPVSLPFPPHLCSNAVLFFIRQPYHHSALFDHIAKLRVLTTPTHLLPLPSFLAPSTPSHYATETTLCYRHLFVPLP